MYTSKGQSFASFENIQMKLFQRGSGKKLIHKAINNSHLWAFLRDDVELIL